jgi:protein-disulfide isomerase
VTGPDTGSGDPWRRPANQDDPTVAMAPIQPGMGPPPPGMGPPPPGMNPPPPGMNPPPPGMNPPPAGMNPGRPTFKPPPKQRERGRIALYIVAGVLAVAVVVGVVIALGRGGGNSAASATYQVRQDAAVVVAGQSTARTTIDIYEDYYCPACARLEQSYGSQITEALNNGQIQVKYHPVLVHHDSLAAANAAVCSVPAGIFPKYHEKLFADQQNRDNAALVALGKELGATGGFEQCVTSGQNVKAIQTESQRALSNKALRSGQGFVAPTATVNGKVVNLADANWLKNAVQQG